MPIKIIEVTNSLGVTEEVTRIIKIITPGAQGVSVKGDPGDAGYTPLKGTDYFDGEPGAPGEPGSRFYSTASGEYPIIVDTNAMYVNLDVPMNITMGQFFMMMNQPEQYMIVQAIGGDGSLNGVLSCTAVKAVGSGTPNNWSIGLVGSPGEAGTTVSVSGTPPENPRVGDLWVDTSI